MKKPIEPAGKRGMIYTHPDSIRQAREAQELQKRVDKGWHNLPQNDFGDLAEMRRRGLPIFKYKDNTK